MQKQKTYESSPYIRRLENLMADCLRQLSDVGIQPCRKIFRIEENRRAKKRLGCCKAVREGRREGFVIEVSSAMKECADDVIKDVIFHELLHTCKGCMNHGPKWKSLAAKVNRTYGYNIQVRADEKQTPGLTERKERDSQYKYEIRCEKCGAVFYRLRRSRVVDHPENYRCSGCGGPLTVRKL